MVFLHCLGLHRAEGAKPHMERHLGDRNAFFLDFLQKLRRKMQPRRGRSRRTVILGINCLIAVFILQLVGNVRRQGHLPQPVKDFLKNPLIGEADPAVAILHHIQHLAH